MEKSNANIKNDIFLFDIENTSNEEQQKAILFGYDSFLNEDNFGSGDCIKINCCKINNNKLPLNVSEIITDKYEEIDYSYLLKKIDYFLYNIVFIRCIKEDLFNQSVNINQLISDIIKIDFYPLIHNTSDILIDYSVLMEQIKKFYFETILLPNQKIRFIIFNSLGNDKNRLLC